MLAHQYFNTCKLVAIELSLELLRICEAAYRAVEADLKLINANVLIADCETLFEARSVERQFLYRQPPSLKATFKDGEFLFETDGWHKDLRLNIHKLS